MELGLQGRKALVCAASKGLGRGCAVSLAREGVDIWLNARNEEELAIAADEISRDTGAAVIPVAADVATEEGRAKLLEACPAPDILVNNAGGPPPGDFRDWERDAWIKALDANMLAPIFLIQAVIDGMIDRKFGRIVNITSAAVKAPIATLGLSNGARAGLTGFVAGLARQVASHNVTINNLLPGPFDTQRLHGNLAAAARKQGVSFEEISAARKRTVPAGRFGDASEFGDACAFFCSAQAGYITGQNLVLDGGAYPGTL